MGWQTASSSVGAAGGPAVAGIVLEQAGIEAYGIIALVLAAALLALVFVLQTGVDADETALETPRVHP